MKFVVIYGLGWWYKFFRILFAVKVHAHTIRYKIIFNFLSRNINAINAINGGK
jgi:hypothetical protein